MKDTGLLCNKLNNQWVLGMLAFGILLYPFLFIWQGGDLTDAGFFVINYCNFFENIAAEYLNSVSLLSDFIGAAWLLLFPSLSTVIGLKLLYLIFFYAIVTVIYQTLKHLTRQKGLLLLGLLCGVIFSTRYTPFIFSRDISSFFFLILTSFLIYKPQKTDKRFLFFASGMTYALACLSRLPNIVFVVLLPVYIVYSNQYAGKKISWNSNLLWKSTKQYVEFVGGTLFTLILGGILLWNLNLLETFVSDLDFVSGKSASSSYTIGYLILSYIKELVHFLPHYIITVSVILTLSLIYNYSRIRKNYFLFRVFILILLGATFLAYGGFSYTSKIKYLIPAFCLTPLLISMVQKDKYGTITMLISLIAISQVAGSNTGFFLKLSFGLIALIPLTILILSSKKTFVFENITIKSKPVIATGICFICFLSMYNRMGYIYHVDAGLLCRWRARYPIEHNSMKGILTTKDNALYVEKLCGLIGIHIKEENTLFIYGHKPMFYHLTGQQPPIKKYWLTNDFVKIDELFLSLEESILKTGKWPLIVDTKQEIMGEVGEVKLSEFFKKNSYIRAENTNDLSIWVKT